MTGSLDLVVVGSANLDLFSTVELIPEPGETVLSLTRDERTGGKGLNQAVAAARAGVRTGLVAAVGTDAAGDRLLREAAAAGVDTSLVRRVEAPTGTAWVVVQADGENAIVVNGGANATLVTLADSDRRALASARVVVAQLEVPLVVVAEAMAAGRSAGATTVLNAAPARALPAALLDDVDVLVVNQGEARAITETDEAKEAAVALARRVATVVITLGADGAMVREGDRDWLLPGVQADVVDTTGAGDTFTGVLAATLAAGLGMREAVARAVVAGALAVETPGAVPSIPTAEQVAARRAAAR